MAAAAFITIVIIIVIGPNPRRHRLAGALCLCRQLAYYSKAATAKGRASEQMFYLFIVSLAEFRSGFQLKSPLPTRHSGQPGRTGRILDAHFCRNF